MRYIPLMLIVSMIAVGSNYSLLNYKPVSDLELAEFLSIHTSLTRRAIVVW